MSDGRASRSDRRESSSSLGVTVELRHDDRSDGDLVLKGARLVVCGLSDGRVHDEDHLVGGDSTGDLLHLFEEGSLLRVSARGVDDDDLVALVLELGDTLGGDLGGVRLRVRAVERDLSLGRVLLELVESSSAEGVSTDECTFEALPLVQVGILGASRSLPASLQPDEHDDVWLLLLGHVGLFPRVEHLAQLVAHGLLEKFALVHARGHRLDVNLFLDLLTQVLNLRHVHVCLQQSLADLGEHLVDHCLVDHCRLCHLAKRHCHLRTKISEHHEIGVWGRLCSTGRRAARAPRARISRARTAKGCGVLTGTRAAHTREPRLVGHCGAVAGSCEHT
mmetsp:Transcript_9121/g.19833  ORF Transcript_9121/g.19833 Transcript_9121/m.19833 type:complete len:335 (+) Transcript_9121:1058-2062(+)